MAQGKAEEVGTGYEKWIFRGREEWEVSIEVDTKPCVLSCWREEWKKVHEDEDIENGKDRGDNCKSQGSRKSRSQRLCGIMNS